MTAFLHPFGAEDGGAHQVAVFERGTGGSLRRVRLPSRPPLTYKLDLVVPADAIERLLDAHEEWRTRRGASLALARAYDWPVILDDALARVGFDS